MSLSWEQQQRLPIPCSRRGTNNSKRDNDDGLAVSTGQTGVTHHPPSHASAGAFLPANRNARTETMAMTPGRSSCRLMRSSTTAARRRQQEKEEEEEECSSRRKWEWEDTDDYVSDPETTVRMLPSPTTNASATTGTISRIRIVLWYILWGALHECIHLLAAWMVLGGDGIALANKDDDLLSLLLRISLGRQCQLPTWLIDHDGEEGSFVSDTTIATTMTIGMSPSVAVWGESDRNGNTHACPMTTGGSSNNDKVSFIRHAGWIISLALALIVHLLLISQRRRRMATKDKKEGGGEKEKEGGRYHGKRRKETYDRWWSSWSSWRLFPFLNIDEVVVVTAYITALEAVSTDLFLLHHIWTPGGSSAAAAATTLYCGNFGLILINPKWIESSRSGGDEGKSALQILQKMISVTMIRGAQSGGVVTFHSRRGGGTTRSKVQERPGELVGWRSRVVNRKRTDLSKLILSKIRRDLYTPLWGTLKGGTSGMDDDDDGGGGGGSSSSVVRMFCGHTRFATSSIANFDGTHPHQWTPPSKRRMYDFLTGKMSVLTVENYITHNGDLDFYDINGTSYELETVQDWLEKATGCRMPSLVDSVCIAAFIDLLRTRGCFALSLRYALLFRLDTSKISQEDGELPTFNFFERLGGVFEDALDEFLEEAGYFREEVGQQGTGGGDGKSKTTRATTVDDVLEAHEKRDKLVSAVMTKLRSGRSGALIRELVPRFIRDDHDDDLEEQSCSNNDLLRFVRETIDAFCDNDLMQATRLFMESARGSFGLCVTSSLDAHRQICLAARGQTMSIAFMPRKGIICYGSEQAAVKAGLSVDTPGGDIGRSEAVRLDLDDLGGEICLLDWGKSNKIGSGGQEKVLSPVSPPSRHLMQYDEMNGSVRVILFQQSKATRREQILFHRMTLLEGNEFILPLRDDTDDLVLSDIQAIPKVCQRIQEDWRNEGPGISFNRFTALNLSRCIVRRMDDIARGCIKRRAETVDVLLTGCEVSLWLAEQFASDLQKAFPKLRILAVSSNKILGLFGQEQSIPAVGYPMSQKTHELTDSIVIIVSHSGGTFGPLQCSNLLQSATKNIFAITSEWDTQIGKQLRSMYTEEDSLFNSRVFTTGVGLSPAEPCSLSVAAMQQLLTNLFQHMCIVMINNPRSRHACGAAITERDLRILERCNRDNLLAMERIVGVDSNGDLLEGEWAKTQRELRDIGRLWADHVLENVRAYMMTFVYVVVTVTTGLPLITAIGDAVGANMGWVAYLLRFFDSLLFFWLPQVNIIILRLFQRRNLRHRMVARTVVIGDIPWVAQSAEAFLSKLFACSYSIAGVNVLSANPADHLVHRHTHRIVRGTLLVCGRPDGRLMALTSSEASVCLSVYQASSIQSWGGTCESVTIGHNPFEIPLCARSVFLDRHRPLFLCERMLDLSSGGKATTWRKPSLLEQLRGTYVEEFEGRKERPVSSTALLGLYSNLKKAGRIASVRRRSRRPTEASAHSCSSAASSQRRRRRSSAIALQVEDVVGQMMEKNVEASLLHKIFYEFDVNGDGKLNCGEFAKAYNMVDPKPSRKDLIRIFEEADTEGRGYLDFEQFYKVAVTPHMKLHAMKQTNIRDSIGLIQVRPSEERFFDDDLKNKGTGINDIDLAQSQALGMELYESRIASLQRFVSMTVMFHSMGKTVADFFSRISFGLWGYRMDRTHSILRVATTASPVSGAYVREQVEQLRLATMINRSVLIISQAWFRYKDRKVEHLIRQITREQSIENVCDSKRGIGQADTVPKRRLNGRVEEQSTSQSHKSGSADNRYVTTGVNPASEGVLSENAVHSSPWKLQLGQRVCLGKSSGTITDVKESGGIAVKFDDFPCEVVVADSSSLEPILSHSDGQVPP